MPQQLICRQIRLLEGQLVRLQRERSPMQVLPQRLELLQCCLPVVLGLHMLRPLESRLQRRPTGHLIALTILRLEAQHLRALRPLAEQRVTRKDSQRQKVESLIPELGYP